jgi:S1-C subfamily serine protease
MTQGASFSPVRRAVCAISAGPSRATGWLVSPKGLFVTSHSALGYQVDATVENESGDTKPARVVWVDVARDLAFVLAEGLPRGAEPMMPLGLREVPAARAGDRVFAVSALPGRGLRISPASICAVSKSPASADLLDTDVHLVGPSGGPLVDPDSRAVGLLVRAAVPPSATASSSRAAPATGPRASAPRAVAVVAAEIRAALRTLESAPDLPRRLPIYKCPACASPFVSEHDACLACGAPLPHPFPPDPANALVERIVRDSLASVGVVANRARVGPRAWQLTSRALAGLDPVVMNMSLDDATSAVAFRAPVALAPKGVREPFYRLLLTLNDQGTGPFRLALVGDRVLLVLVVPPAILEGRELGPMLASMAEMTDHYRKLLQEGFDAPALTSLDDPPEW